MGSLSDFSVGTGTSPFSASSGLTSVPTQSLRAGDLAYIQNVNTNTFQWWAFDPASTKAVDADTVYADIAQNTPANAGRWRRTNIAYA